MPGKQHSAEVFVAKHTGFVNTDEGDIRIVRGITRVRADSELYKRAPNLFEVDEQLGAPAVEQATAAPGESRGV